MSSSNMLYIYSKPAERLLTEGERPPLRVEQLMRRDLKGAVTLAMLAFSLNEKPRFCWNDSHGWLELPHTLMSAIFSDAQDFLSALPSIQDWLTNWSKSDNRAPNLTPDWAVSRNTSSAVVYEFSRILLQQLSMATSRSVAFCDYSGAESMLVVPARASLTLPPKAFDDAKELYVVSKEQALKFVLPTGREVLLPIMKETPKIEVGSKPLLVDPRRFQKKQVTHVKRIRTFPTDNLSEDPS